jgi:outer membrane protein assembly factor BamA
VELGQAIGGYRYTRALLDWRKYTSIGFPFSFATRVTSIGHFGRDENLFPTFIGTPDNVRGYTYGSLLDNECRSTFVGQAQGCPILDQLIGSRMAVASAEFRFPLLRSLALGFAPIGLPPVEAAIFYDVGLSWQDGSTIMLRRNSTDPSSVRAPITSYGASLRFNLFNFVILSVDYARPLNRPDFRRGYWIVSLYPPW